MRGGSIWARRISFKAEGIYPSRYSAEPVIRLVKIYKQRTGGSQREHPKSSATSAQIDVCAPLANLNPFINRCRPIYLYPGLRPFPEIYFPRGDLTPKQGQA